MTTASDFRRVRYIKPSEPCVPIVLHDGTAGYALTRPAVEGVALRRPRRDRCSGRMTYPLSGTGWMLVDATTGERLRGPDGLSWPVLMSLDELKAIKPALRARDLSAAKGALHALHQQQAAKRQAAQQAAEEAATAAAASLGLRPWHEASPFEETVQKELLRNAAGRSLRDWRDVVMVGIWLVEINHYQEMRQDRPHLLQKYDVIAACGWKKAEKTIATPTE